MTQTPLISSIRTIMVATGYLNQRKLIGLVSILVIRNMVAIFQGLISSKLLLKKTEFLNSIIRGTYKLNFVRSLVYLHSIRLGLTLTEETCITRAINEFAQTLKLKLFSALMSQDMSYFETEGSEDIGFFRSLINESEATTRYFLSNEVPRAITILTTLISAGLSCYQQSFNTLLFLCTILMVSYSLDDFYLTPKTIDKHKITHIWKILSDTRRLRIFKFFGQEEGGIREYASFLKESSKARFYNDQTQKLVDFFVATIEEAIQVIPFIVLPESSLTSAWLPTLPTRILELNSLKYIFGEFANKLASIHNMAGLLESNPTIGISGFSNSATVDVTQPWKFENVYFAYPSKKHTWVLKGASFTIDPKVNTGIMGDNGSGKSTILNLIGRIYDPDEGQILIGDTNIKDIPPLWLRKQLTYLPQADVFFAYDYQGKEQDFDTNFRETLLSDKEVDQLSGGKARKLSIQRALSENRPLILLDEPSNSLDIQYHADFEEVLHSFQGIVKISHRIEDLLACDHLIVIHDGRVLEEGSPATLLSKSSHFRSQYDLTAQNLNLENYVS